MTAATTTCRRCGVEFEPDRAAILAGAWRLCPDCRDAPSPTNHPSQERRRGAPERPPQKPTLPYGCCGHPVTIGHQIHRCSGCEPFTPDLAEAA